MRSIPFHNQWLIEEYLLALALGYVVRIPIPGGIPLVPLEPRAVSQSVAWLHHGKCISQTYTRVNGYFVLFLGRTLAMTR